MTKFIPLSDLKNTLGKMIILYYNNGNKGGYTMTKTGDRILSLLKQSGYSQKELASMVGVTEAAMSRYLKNEREPKIEVVANLATALNTTVDYLVNGRSESNTFDEVYHNDFNKFQFGRRAVRLSPKSFEYQKRGVKNQVFYTSFYI